MVSIFTKIPEGSNLEGHCFVEKSPNKLLRMKCPLWPKKTEKQDITQTRPVFILSTDRNT